MSPAERESLKEGDKVGACERWSAAILTVKKRTKTQLVLSNGSRWSIRTGRKFGDGSWSFALLTTEEEGREKIAELRAQRLRQESVKKLNDFRWQDLPDEELAKFVALLPSPLIAT